MPKSCPWCGRILEIRMLDLGEKIRHVCAKCGFKIKETNKPRPEPKKEEPKTQVVEVEPEQVPQVKQVPAWPFIVGGIVLVIIIVILIRVFLIK